MRSVLSALPDTILPSGRILTQLTQCVCPLKHFTTPIAVGSSAPDAERIVITTRNDSAIGEGLEARDCIRVPLKDFTLPRAVGIFAPDAERHRRVTYYRRRFFHRVGPGGREPPPCVLQGLHYSNHRWELCSRCVASCHYYPTRFCHRVGPGGKRPISCARSSTSLLQSPLGALLQMRSVLSSLPETILPSGRAWRQSDQARVPFEHFTTPITVVELLAPDTERLVVAPRHDSPVGKGLETPHPVRVPLKYLTAPSAVGLVAPDAERIAGTP